MTIATVQGITHTILNTAGKGNTILSRNRQRRAQCNDQNTCFPAEYRIGNDFQCTGPLNTNVSVLAKHHLGEREYKLRRRIIRQLVVGRNTGIVSERPAGQIRLDRAACCNFIRPHIDDRHCTIAGVRRLGIVLEASLANQV